MYSKAQMLERQLDENKRIRNTKSVKGANTSKSLICKYIKIKKKIEEKRTLSVAQLSSRLHFHSSSPLRVV